MRRRTALLALLGLLAAPPSGAAERQAPLAVGERAPDFTLADQSGKPVTLSEVLGRRSAVVLAFYIKADTPGSLIGTLSSREMEVLTELAQGLSNKLIARALQMTENTVKFHLKNVFQKLGVKHRAQAIRVAQDQGLVR